MFHLKLTFNVCLGSLTCLNLHLYAVIIFNVFLNNILFSVCFYCSLTSGVNACSEFLLLSVVCSHVGTEIKTTTMKVNAMCTCCIWMLIVSSFIQSLLLTRLCNAFWTCASTLIFFEQERFNIVHFHLPPSSVSSSFCFLFDYISNKKTSS